MGLWLGAEIVENMGSLITASPTSVADDAHTFPNLGVVEAYLRDPAEL
jgi:hypothetical protein